MFSIYNSGKKCISHDHSREIKLVIRMLNYELIKNQLNSLSTDSRLSNEILNQEGQKQELLS